MHTGNTAYALMWCLLSFSMGCNRHSSSDSEKVEKVQSAYLELARRDLELTVANYRTAESNSNREVLRLFEDAAFDPERPFVYPPTLLGWACGVGNMEVIRRQIEKGKDPNRVTVGEPPMFYACGWNRTNVIEYLIQHGADPNITLWSPDTGPNRHPIATPLSTACKHGSLETVRLLVARGAVVTGDVGELARKEASSAPGVGRWVQSKMLDALKAAR